MSHHATAHHLPQHDAPAPVEALSSVENQLAAQDTRAAPETRAAEEARASEELLAPAEPLAVEEEASSGQDEECGLVNPVSGLANDYLNVFNEALLLIEFLPTMPEMADEALAWRPRGYRDYFRQSPLPGAGEALRRYERIDARKRRKFESLLARLNEIVSAAQTEVSARMDGPDFPDSIAGFCEETAATMRIGLDYVARLINESPPETSGRSAMGGAP